MIKLNEDHENKIKQWIIIGWEVSNKNIDLMWNFV